MFNQPRPMYETGKESFPFTEEHYEPAQTFLGRERRMVWLRGPVVGAPQRYDVYAPHIVHDSILAYNYVSTKDPIYLMIDSPGGMIGDGLVLFDVIKMSKAPIITICQQAASMATVLFVAGSTRLVYPNARIMIHLPQGGAHGDVKEVEIQAAEMKKTSNILAQIYIDAGAHRTVKQLLHDIDREFWMGAQEAIDYGIADRIITQDELFGVVGTGSR